MELNTSLVSMPTDKFGIKTYFTTNIGGVSKNEFKSFNLALHVDDDPNDVLKNRRLLEQLVGHKIVYMNQTHSSVVKKVGIGDAFDTTSIENNSNLLGVDADGIYTDDKNIAIAVLTADCLPLLLFNEDKSLIAAIHCGWKGIYRGIIDEAVLKFKEQSSSKIYALIGPHITQQSFEVGVDVLEKFEEILPDAIDAFVLQKNQKYLCSLSKLCEKILQKYDAKIIFNSNLDTKTTPQLYSYRRSSRTGRICSLISFN